MSANTMQKFETQIQPVRREIKIQTSIGSMLHIL
jgi:hypothetical protein